MSVDTRILSTDVQYVPTDAQPPLKPADGESNKIKVQNIDQQHPEYKVLSETWQKLGFLYAGGWALKSAAELFLVRRPKELSDVYQARLNMFTYVNHLGTALDWYASELFEEDPHIQPLSKAKNAGQSTDKVSPSIKEFYDGFLLNCDRAGTSFVDLFRTAFQDVLLYRKVYVLMDLPAKKDYQNYDEQKQDGALDPYLCVYNPLQVINWQLDSYGNLDWIIIKVQSRRNPNAKEIPKVVDRWYYYDRKTYEVWERIHDENEQKTPDNAFADLVDSGEHLLAKSNVVPVQCLQVPDGLWLANRAMLAAISHLNTDNSLYFALFMAALAMPIIMADTDLNVTLTESGYIHLPKDAKFEWTEPTGTSFSHLSDRLNELTENIFRSFYLIHQGRSGRATPTAQSGVSKQIDMMPSKDILKMFGDLVRAFMQRILNMVSQGHGDDSKAIEWDVRGFEFKDDLSLEEVQAIGEMFSLSIPSDTFEKELSKRVIKAGLPDANPKVIRTAFEEVDKAKSRDERNMDQLKKKVSVLGPSGQAPKISQVQAQSKDTGMDAGEQAA